MNKEMTTCEYDGDIRQWSCQRDEQCDECFLKDHLKECEWCEQYDHPTRKLAVAHLASDYPTDAPSVDALLAHLEKQTGFSLEIEEDEGDRIAADYADSEANIIK